MLNIIVNACQKTLSLHAGTCTTLLRKKSKYLFIFVHMHLCASL